MIELVAMTEGARPVRFSADLLRRVQRAGIFSPARLRDLVKASGLTEEQIGVVIGRSAQTVRNWMRDPDPKSSKKDPAAQPRLTDAARLARVLGCSVSDFLLSPGGETDSGGHGSGRG